MELLSALEKRIDSLLGYVRDLHARNSDLETANKILKSENDALLEKASSSESQVAALQDELENFKAAIFQHNKELDDLNQEKAVAKLLIEDLIKNIETSVMNEQGS